VKPCRQQLLQDIPEEVCHDEIHAAAQVNVARSSGAIKCRLMDMLLNFSKHDERKGSNHIVGVS